MKVSIAALSLALLVLTRDSLVNKSGLFLGDPGQANGTGVALTNGITWTWCP